MIRASLLLALVAASAPAAADPVKAGVLVDEGNDAFAAGDFKTAVGKYTAAYRENSARSDAFCNMGISYFKLEDLPRAHLLLEQCVVRSSLELAFKDTATAVIAQIDQTLRAAKHTPVTFKVTPEGATVVIAEFGEESKFLGDRTVWLGFGTHHVTVRMDGWEPQTVEVVTSDQNRKEVQIILREKPRVIVPPRPVEPSKPSKLPALVATGVTAVALGVTVLAFARGRSAASAGELALDPKSLGDLEDDVSTWNTVLAIGGIATLAGGGVSSYLWYRATRSPSTTVEVTPTTGGAAVRFSGRF